MQISGLPDLLIWLLVVELLAFAILPWIVELFQCHIDRDFDRKTHLDFGYGLSKLLGVFLLGVLSWLPSAWGVVPVSPEWVTCVFLLILLSGFYQWTATPSKCAFLRRVVASHWIQVEGLFLVLTLLFLYIRFLNPEIVWGEKPMDSTFLHFFVRNQEIPPQDPWGAGHAMSYYYLGIYLLAAILKLTGIPAAVGYNLAIATLAGFIGSSLYTLFNQLTKTKWAAGVVSLILILSSDPEVLRLTILEKRPPNFDTFWASTRVMTSPNFFEYTSWSLLFADLHAHVISIPFTVALLTLGVVAFLNSHQRYTSGGVMLRVLIGIVLGVLYAANTWDVLTYGGVIAILLAVSSAPRFWSPPVGEDGRVLLRERIFASLFSRISAWIWDVGCVCVPFLIVTAPYATQSGARTTIHMGWAAVGEFNTLSQITLMLGYWFATIVVSVTILAALHVLKPRVFIGRALTAILCTAVLLVIPKWNELQSGSGQQPWGLLIFAATLSGVLFSLAAISSPNSQRDRVAFLFGACGAALIVVLEEFYLIDRMNTLFKGYMAVWMLLGISSLLLMVKMLSTTLRESGISGVVLAASPIVLIMICSGVGAVLNAVSVANTQRIEHREFTLDGAAYLAKHAPGDSFITSWINAHVKGTPTILEAHGDAYGPYTRISMFTGLPTVLGWEHHVKQRGLDHREVEERKDAIKSIYTTSDLLLARMLLLRYRVEFVVVGDIERTRYGEKGLTKFFENRDLFVPVVSAGGTTLFVTHFSDYFRNQITSGTSL